MNSPKLISDNSSSSINRMQVQGKQRQKQPTTSQGSQTTQTTAQNQSQQQSQQQQQQQQQPQQQDRLQQHRQSQQIDQSDEEIESSPSQILERVKSDRVTVTKPEEDRRRRTIIVEKKNGSFGFTLQSYGIHYKKEQEIEMITYVDYVDYDGPAYRAGMREGDVILSINGNDMEKADHKTLVNFIKNCDSRMRMVVLFEDCVRKVELHIRYIQLQRVLQNKMEELEKLCFRERQILEGKWKTHSLPARKKASSVNPDDNGRHPTQQTNYAYCRSTLSTEDIVNKVHPVEPQPTLLLSYQYLDPHYRTYVIPQIDNGTGEYLLNLCPQRTCRLQDQHHFIVKTPCDNNTRSNKTYHQSNGLISSNSNSMKNENKKAEGHSSRHHLCNPCMKASNNQDSTSLEAYDLASPCCDPHCVPSTRRRSRNHKGQHSKRDCQGSVDQPGDDCEEKKNHYGQQRNSKHSMQSQQQQHISSHPTPKHRYLNFGAGLVSQCSLHSCTSSEFSNTQVAGMAESSAASYTTSLSTDTLYWDAPAGEFNRQQQHSNKNLPKQHTYHHPQRTHYYQTSVEGGGSIDNDQGQQYTQYNPVKPKSWDNLTTKSFGGYGFGYGYLDTSAKHHKSRPQTPKSNQQMGQNPNGGQYSKHNEQRHSAEQQQQGNYGRRPSRQYVQPTKSTESLLALPKYETDPTLSDSSLSCECLDASTPDASAHSSHFFIGKLPSPIDSRGGYYSRRSSARVNGSDINIVSTSSEITRL